MSDNPILVIMVLVFLGFGIFALFRHYYSKEARTRRALNAQERVPISEVPEGGIVKIAGRITYLGTPLEAPLSGRRCACWEVVVQERVQRGKNRQWREIIREQATQEFLVEDDTARAKVEAECFPQMALEQDGHFSSGTFNDPTPELVQFLAENGYETAGLFGFNRTYRFREGVLEEGEAVAVLGKARWEADPDGMTRGGYRDSPRRVVLTDPDEGRMLLSDSVSTTK